MSQSHWTQLGQAASQESPHRQVCTPCQQLALDGSGTPPTKRADLAHFKVVSVWESDTYWRSTKTPVISSSRLYLAELYLKPSYQICIPVGAQFGFIGWPIGKHHDIRNRVHLLGARILATEEYAVFDGFHRLVVEVFLHRTGEVEDHDALPVIGVLQIHRFAIFHTKCLLLHHKVPR